MGGGILDRAVKRAVYWYWYWYWYWYCSEREASTRGKEERMILISFVVVDCFYSIVCRGIRSVRAMRGGKTAVQVQ